MPFIPHSAPLFDTAERALAETAARLAFVNPFAPAPAEDLPPIRTRLEALLDRLRHRLADGVAAIAADLVLYREGCIFFLLDRYAARLRACIHRGPGPVEVFRDFAAEHARLGAAPGVELPPAAHLFAFGFQIQRAIDHIASTLLGGSFPAQRLRAHVWESIFTHNMRRYLRTLFARMDEIPTLVLGPSGTGKELVARAIGLSRYVPFDPDKGAFAWDHRAAFHAINLSAVAPSVIESELFGHRRGSFTGAVADKSGWLGLGGALFLDEFGDLSGDIQVKLLRVIQERTFQRVGDTEPQPLSGKLIAATHKDLDELIQKGTFRLDLYMRICADRIVTPSLREMLDSAPGERRTLVRHLALEVAGPDDADELTDEVEAWIDARLPPDYAWPGNVRELEQYVRRRLIHLSRRPSELAVPPPEPAPSCETGRPGSSPDPEADAEEKEFDRAFHNGTLSAGEVFGHYATVVLAQTGSAREAARRLCVDRRLVARSINHTLLARLVARQRGTAATRGEGGEDGEDE